AHTHTHARTHARTHACTRTRTRTHTHTHAHAHAHAHAHTDTHSHTHTHTHTLTQTLIQHNPPPEIECHAVGHLSVPGCPKAMYSQTAPFMSLMSPQRHGIIVSMKSN